MVLISSSMARMRVVLLCAFLLRLFLSSSVLGYTNEEDVYALNVLFSTFNNPPLNGWVASGGDPCSENWQGVACVGPNVTSLNLSGANLMGALGYSLENLTALIVLDLSNNLLSGVIPYQLPPHVQHLILAGNHFSGNLPYSLPDLSNLEILNASNNMLSGDIPDVFVQSGTLTTVDLSNNNLGGRLPQSFGGLTLLSSLYLQNNQLNGTIDILASLPLKDLDISNNSFTGWIPAPLMGIPYIDFTGNPINTSPAPPPPPYTQPPPPLHISPPNSTHNGSVVKGSEGRGGGHRFMSSGRIAGIAIAAVLGTVTIVLVIMAFPWRRCRSGRDEEKLGSGSPWLGRASLSLPVKAERKEEPLLIRKPPPPPEIMALMPPSSPQKMPTRKPPAPNLKEFSIAELQSATNSFSESNLMGGKYLGPVYKAVFPSGEVLAIRRLDSTRVSEEIFFDIISSISRLSHENITQFVGFCAEHGEHLLIYKFISNGTLYEALYSGRRNPPLSWNARIKIALGVAKALEYLHEVCRPSVVHQNVNSFKILLDEELNPHVSDCGLAPLMSDSQVPVVDDDPEWVKSGFYSDRSDVYSFGVVMLELMTGHKPLHRTKQRTGQSLVRWAIPQLQYIDALENMVDPALNGTYPKKELSRFADVIAFCLNPQPEFRPPMSEVTVSLQGIMKCSERDNTEG